MSDLISVRYNFKIMFSGAASLLHCFSTGDLRRANGLLARYGSVLHEDGSPSILMYNLLMKVLR